jgi:hypothetical protein
MATRVHDLVLAREDGRSSIGVLANACLRCLESIEPADYPGVRMQFPGRPSVWMHADCFKGFVDALRLFQVHIMSARSHKVN